MAGSTEEASRRNTSFFVSPYITKIFLTLAALAFTLSISWILLGPYVPSPASDPKFSSLLSDMLATDSWDVEPIDIQKVVYIIRHGEKIRDPVNETAYLYACLSDQGYSRADHLVETFSSDNGNLVVPNSLFSFNYDNHLDCLDPLDGIYRTQATLRPLANALGIAIDSHCGAKPDLCGLGTIEDTPGIPDDDEDVTPFSYNHQVCHHPRATGSVHNFGMCCNLGAAEAIRRKLFADPTTTSAVLVAWEHANIGYLAEALMANDEDNASGPHVTKFVSTGPAHADVMDWPDDSFDAIWALWFDPRTQEFDRIDTKTLIQGFGN